jgi:hypothetical protein
VQPTNAGATTVAGWVKSGSPVTVTISPLPNRVL